MNRGKDPYPSHYRMAERKLRTALISGITTISVQVLREEIPLESGKWPVYELHPPNY